MDSQTQWPDVFLTGETSKEATDKELCAAAFCAWGSCYAGFVPPEKFGEGMVAIGKRLGISPTADNLKSFAIEKGWLS
jgi:hypothetical protein